MGAGAAGSGVWINLFFIFRSGNENHQLRLKIFRCVRNQIRNNNFTFNGTGAGAAGNEVSKGSAYFLCF